jgi:hypothetical protein
MLCIVKSSVFEVRGRVSKIDLAAVSIDAKNQSVILSKVSTESLKFDFLF